MNAMDAPTDAQGMHGLMAELFPHVRSITGPGLRATLDVLGQHLPLRQTHVPTGTRLFDWTVPDEWVLRSASLTDPSGRRVVDSADHPLHVVSYSEPVRRRVSREELEPHLHSLPEHPDWVPYRTSYYRRTWGFCLTEKQRRGLTADAYDVVVDADLQPGVLSYGEVVLPGSTEEEVLLSAHVCHPGMANDNLSGIAVATWLGRALAERTTRYTYRLVFAPGTIGALAWLHDHLDLLPRVRHGVVLTGLGGPGPLVYKATRRGDAQVDRAAAHVVRRRGGEVRPYSPYGYDERQYNAPGFDLAVGRLSRTPHGEYPEYHTSADDLSFVSPDRLGDAVAALLELVDTLEGGDQRYRSLCPYGEPQLGRRGLYPSVGGTQAEDEVMAMLWVLAYSDDEHSLLDVAERAGVAVPTLRGAAQRLVEAGLLTPLCPSRLTSALPTTKPSA